MIIKTTLAETTLKCLGLLCSLCISTRELFEEEITSWYLVL